MTSQKLTFRFTVQRLVHTMGEDTVRYRTGQGHILAGAFTLFRSGISQDRTRARCSMYQDVGQFGCGSVYFGSRLWRNLEKIKNKKKRIWTNDMFVWRCNEAGFNTLFQKLRRDPVKHRQYVRKSTASATKSSCLRFSRRRCDFGCHREWR
jgi:hypothetical protein